jgi:hypothetical protein
MHPVAPRTGADEFNIAEAQHEYMQLVGARYLLNYADGLPPADTVLTRWRMTDLDLSLLLGVSVQRIREIRGERRGEDVYLALLTFNQPLQPINIQVGPRMPTNWLVGDVAPEPMEANVQSAHAAPGPVFTPDEWAQARASVAVGDAPDVHRLTVALSNFALPDGDPQKFTHADVDELRRVGNQLDEQGRASLNALADKIANYLPPHP